MILFRRQKPHFTSLLITFLIVIQMSACTMENNFATKQDTGTNHAAIITGDDRKSITEDANPAGANLPEVNGMLNITDSDAGETGFIETTVNGNYGSLAIDMTGNWTYSSNNNLAALQNLNSETTLTDSLIINSIDGTPHTITITINGIDETNNPALITGIDRPGAAKDVAADDTKPPEIRRKLNTPNSNASDAAFIATINNSNIGSKNTNRASKSNTPADITLSWLAPAEREDNSALSLSAIAGYQVYYGTTQGQYLNSVTINDGAAADYTFTGLPADTYYFVITTIDTEGRESLYSSEVTIII